MKKSLYFIVVVLLSACTLSPNLNKIYVNDDQVDAKASAEYESYPQIGVGEIQSANYELIKIAELSDSQNGIRGMLFMPESKNLIVHSWVYSFIMLDTNGNFIDSYSGDAHLHNSGVFFHQDDYVDWLLTGDKTKKKYAQYIQGDSLSKSQFETLFNKADATAYKTMWNYEPINDFARNLLKIEDSWIVIENELSKFEDTKKYSDRIKHHQNFYNDASYRFDSPENKKAYDALQSTISPFYEWKETATIMTCDPEIGHCYYESHDATNPIYIKAHKHRVAYDEGGFMEPHRKKGWDSTGYFHIIVGDELLKFKAYTYLTEEWNNFEPYIQHYFHPENPDISILIVNGEGSGKGDRDSREIGVYVIRKKAGL